jgi:hypothetical protein
METGVDNDGEGKKNSFFKEFTLTQRPTSRRKLFGGSFERRQRILKYGPETGKVPHKLAPSPIHVETELGNQRIGDPELGQGIT